MNRLPDGITIHAKPATNRLPIVQKAAIKLNIEPRLDFGWNSAKYDQITGPEPPKLLNRNQFAFSSSGFCLIIV